MSSTRGQAQVPLEKAMSAHSISRYSPNSQSISITLHYSPANYLHSQSESFLDSNGKDHQARMMNGRVVTVDFIDGIGQIHMRIAVEQLRLCSVIAPSSALNPMTSSPGSG